MVCFIMPWDHSSHYTLHRVTALAVEQAKPRQLELPDYIRILQKRKWFILLVVAAAVIMGGLYSFSSEKMYTASSHIIVQQQPKGFFWVTGKEANILPTVALDTYARMARGNQTAKLTVERLGAMPTSSRIITTVEEVTGSIEAVVIPPDLLRIDARSLDPTKAVAFANYTADSFVQVNTEMRQTESKGARIFLEDQVEKAKEELERVVAETVALSRDAGLSDVEMDSQAMSVILRDFESQHVVVGAEVEQLRSKVAELTRLVAEHQAVTVSTQPSANNEWAQIWVGGREADIALTVLRAKYTDEHPRVRDAVARVEELKAQLAETPEVIEQQAIRPSAILGQLERDLAASEVELRSAEANYAELGKAVSEMQADVAALPEMKQQWRSLTARAEAMREVYLNLQQELRQAKLSEAIKQGNAMVMDTATTARLVRASLGRALIFSGALGLFVGLGLGIVLEALDDTIYSVDDLRRVTEMRFLGVIPLRTDESTELVTVAAPKSPPAEAYRSLRTNIRFALFDTTVRTFMVSSAGTGEGKSLTAANLAVAYAQSGESVILVDTDLRRPVLHRLFDVESAPGLTNVIVGDSNLQDTLQATEVPGLRVLSSGPLPPNPAELLESEHMDELIEALKEEADVVVFDSPPALMLADAGILASKLDATVLVAESGQITYRALSDMERVFGIARANVVGVVLNKLRVTGGDYYYYYYYYYHDYSDREGGRRRSGRSDSDAEELAERMKDVVSNGNDTNNRNSSNDSNDSNDSN